MTRTNIGGFSRYEIPVSESLPDLERQQVCPKSVGSKVTWNGARTDFPEPIAYTFYVPWLQNFLPLGWESPCDFFPLTRIRRQPVKKRGDRPTQTVARKADAISLFAGSAKVESDN